MAYASRHLRFRKKQFVGNSRSVGEFLRRRPNLKGVRGFGAFPSVQAGAEANKAPHASSHRPVHSAFGDRGRGSMACFARARGYVAFGPALIDGGEPEQRGISNGHCRSFRHRSRDRVGRPFRRSLRAVSRRRLPKFDDIRDCWTSGIGPGRYERRSDNLANRVGDIVHSSWL